MPRSIPFLNAGEAAKRLAISPKALRLYEERGFLTPTRRPAGYRVYGPDDISRAAGKPYRGGQLYVAH